MRDMRSWTDGVLYEYAYDSPCGTLLIATGESKVYAVCFDESSMRRDVSGYDKPVFVDRKDPRMPAAMRETIDWLDLYFGGDDPGETPEISTNGTAFQEEVWGILNGIPYGKTVTYGEIAEELAGRRGIKKMSAQAVGNAVGRNPVAILIPCHRVIGADGSLTGYAGGLERKRFLLDFESRQG